MVNRTFFEVVRMSASINNKIKKLGPLIGPAEPIKGRRRPRSATTGRQPLDPPLRSATSLDPPLEDDSAHDLLLGAPPLLIRRREPTRWRRTSRGCCGLGREGMEGCAAHHG
jgi:hypothetical protein